MNGLLVVLCTFPDAAKAQQIATILVERQLAACVNLLPGLASTYRWQGKIETTTEVLAIIKTTRDVYEGMAAVLGELHPYEVPEIVALSTDQVFPPYFHWILSSLQEAPAGGGDVISGG